MENKDFSTKMKVIDDMLTDLYQQKLDLLAEQAEQEDKDKYVITPKKNTVAVKDTALRHFKSENKFLASAFQEELKSDSTGFLKNSQDLSIYADKIFSLNNKAKEDNAEEVYNATLGVLCDENKQIYTFNCVYDSYNRLTSAQKAAYSQSIEGNKQYNQEVFKQINQLNNLKLPHQVIATAGGTGAIFLSLTSFLNDGEEILLPQTAWSSYALMSKYYNLQSIFYKLVDDNNQVDLTDLMLRSLQIIKKQHKLVVVINDPCQNPTGICLGENNWKILIEYFNRLKEYGKVIIINDVAYIDYCYQQSHNYLQYFNNIDDNIAVMIAYSCSKSLTSYGMRLGANIIMHKEQKTVDEIYNSMIKACRATWSNVNNAMMLTYVDLMNNNYAAYQREKQAAVDLLKIRSTEFIKKAQQVQLPLFPYTAGFFVTVKIDDKDILDKYHQKLIDHHIYTVKSTGGIRISICSLTVDECKTLPEKMQKALKECLNG
ncbi:MAG: aminotransferase class I/II-fold pyridoxal phosphate-dependent enzyme [Erysipelotrichia bacterium]|nr:aminotransferase class I/II-fold pyridoxal phosphate-dependent enzyme [Erysipelotrichia bacterium]